jgi:hypothetical protein
MSINDVMSRIRAAQLQGLTDVHVQNLLTPPRLFLIRREKLLESLEIDVDTLAIFQRIHRPALVAQGINVTG